MRYNFGRAVGRTYRALPTEQASAEHIKIFIDALNVGTLKREWLAGLLPIQCAPVSVVKKSIGRVEGNELSGFSVVLPRPNGLLVFNRSTAPPVNLHIPKVRGRPLDN